jgi:hypothetical protein
MLEWTWDPDPTDNTYMVDFAFILREDDATQWVEQDRHIEGLFPRGHWLRILSETGFVPATLPFEQSDLEPTTHEVFIAKKPAAAGAPRRTR